MTVVCNLYAGPGTGKSTIAAQLFSEMKWLGFNCELVTEYAKDKVWEGSHNVLQHQIYVFAKQLFRIQRLIDKVDLIITDSPILLSLVYGSEESREFHDLVLAEHLKLNSLNFLLERTKPYKPEGRLQSEMAARIIDQQIKFILDSNNIDYLPLVATKKDAESLARRLPSMIERKLAS